MFRTASVKTRSLIDTDVHRGAHCSPPQVIGDDCVAANILVKLEMQNPGGSVKDRIALSMIEEVRMQTAEHRGATRRPLFCADDASFPNDSDCFFLNSTFESHGEGPPTQVGPPRGGQPSQPATHPPSHLPTSLFAHTQPPE